MEIRQLRYNERVVELAREPYEFQFKEDFEKHYLEALYGVLCSDGKGLMCEKDGEEGFLGGYILGHVIKTGSGMVKQLRGEEAGLKYLGVSRFCQAMRISPDELPDSVTDQRDITRDLIAKVQIGKKVFHRIYVRELAYLDFPRVVIKHPSEMDLIELIREHRFGGSDAARLEFMKKYPGEDAEKVLHEFDLINGETVDVV